MHTSSLLKLIVITLFIEAGTLCALQEPATNKVTNDYGTLSTDELPSIIAIYESYLQNNGGRANLQNIQTIRIKAELLTKNDEEIRLQIFRKRPNKIRVKQHLPDDVTLDRIYNGSRGWFRHRSPKTDNWREMNEVEIKSVNQAKDLEGPFFRIFGRDDIATLEGIETINGEDAYRISISDSSDIGYDTIWLSTEHFQEVKLARLVTIEKAKIVEELYFSDFTQINQVYFPNTTKQFYDQELQYELTISGISINGGIFDSYFERPPEQ